MRRAYRKSTPALQPSGAGNVSVVLELASAVQDRELFVWLLRMTRTLISQSKSTMATTKFKYHVDDVWANLPGVRDTSIQMHSVQATLSNRTRNLCKNATQLGKVVPEVKRLFEYSHAGPAMRIEDTRRKRSSRSWRKQAFLRSLFQHGAAPDQ
jgi:hypothetical protein